jgi:hypothetical protein
MNINFIVKFFIGLTFLKEKSNKEIFKIILNVNHNFLQIFNFF